MGARVVVDSPEGKSVIDPEYCIISDNDIQAVFCCYFKFWRFWRLSQRRNNVLDVYSERNTADLHSRPQY